MKFLYSGELSVFNQLFYYKGFTLIELSVVVLIMALLTAAVVPNLQEFHARHKLETAALQVQQEIRTLGREALNRETGDYRIKFAPVEDYYIVYGPEGEEYIYMPAGIDLSSTNFNNDQINFSARGLPMQSGTIVLKDNLTGDLKYIIVAPVTGRVRVSDSPSID